MRVVKPLFHNVIRYDVPASLAVFLVALPSSIGIAVASGPPVGSADIAEINQGGKYLDGLREVAR